MCVWSMDLDFGGFDIWSQTHVWTPRIKFMGLTGFGIYIFYWMSYVSGKFISFNILSMIIDDCWQQMLANFTINHHDRSTVIITDHHLNRQLRIILIVNSGSSWSSIINRLDYRWSIILLCWWPTTLDVIYCRKVNILIDVYQSLSLIDVNQSLEIDPFWHRNMSCYSPSRVVDDIHWPSVECSAANTLSGINKYYLSRKSHKPS